MKNNYQDMYRAIAAQAIVDATYYCKNPKTYGRRIEGGYRRIREHEQTTRPTRLQSFQAWRWCFDPKYEEDRHAICAAADLNPKMIEDVFSAYTKKRGKALESWARGVLLDRLM